MASLEIPGFDLDYKSQYKKKSFLGAGEEFFQKNPLHLPDDIPPGKYKGLMSVRANSLGKTLRNEAETVFEIK